MDITRRRFLEAAAVASVAPALGAGAAPKLPSRPFGKTGLEVPILGFGGGGRFLMYGDEGEALAALGRAIDLGITYIESVHAYGGGKSKERVGRLMPERRGQVVLATKLPGRTNGGMKATRMPTGGLRGAGAAGRARGWA